MTDTLQYRGLVGTHPTAPAAGSAHLYWLKTDGRYYLQTSDGHWPLSLDGAVGTTGDYVTGLALSRLSDYQLQIGAGRCRDSTDTVLITVASTLTASLAASGANGLDTGVEAANTWYYPFVISGSSGVASLLSASSTAPTMPSGYNYARRVGSARNNGSSNLYRAKFFGRNCRRLALYDEQRDSGEFRVLNNGSQTGWTTVSCAAVVPPTATEINLMLSAYQLLSGAQFAEFRAYGFTNATTGHIFVSDVQGNDSVALPNVEQKIEYHVTNSAVDAYADVIGYIEEI